MSAYILGAIRRRAMAKAADILSRPARNDPERVAELLEKHTRSELYKMAQKLRKGVKWPSTSHRYAEIIMQNEKLDG